MKKVYLFCNAGMSTSILASVMQKFADGKNLAYEIKAYPHDELREIMHLNRPDCILLGPQVKLLYEETVKEFGDAGVPIQVIDSESYGLMNGEAVLKSAVIAIRNHK